MLTKLLNLLFPSRCPVCGEASDDYRHNPVCKACWRSIEKYSGSACRVCGMPTVSPLTTLCESCIKTKPPFSQILFFGAYEGALKEAIHLLKFKGIKRLAGPLGRLLAELPLPVTGGIIPVPLHRKDLRQREFNQTALLGRSLAKTLSVPLMPYVLVKERETLPQTDVTGKERLRNVKNAFRAVREVRGMELLLIDDVITTGATVGECARMLMKAGARSVTAVALARSLPRQNR